MTRTSTVTSATSPLFCNPLTYQLPESTSRVCCGVEVDGVTLPAPVAPKPTTTTTTTDVIRDDQTVLSTRELRQMRDEMKQLQETVHRLRTDCDRHVRELREELEGEKTARLQLVSEVERLKKVVATKLRVL